MIDEIKFVHPKDMQDGKIEIGPGDITTNLPVRPGRRISPSTTTPREAIRVEDAPDEPHHRRRAPVGGARGLRLLRRRRALPDDLRRDDGGGRQGRRRPVLRATRSSTRKGWVLLHFLMDPRTGLGRFREFRISNYQLMMELIDACTS